MQERKRSLPRVLWKQRTLCLMILPAIILLFMFNYLPLYGLTIAFRDFNYRDGIWNSPWIGLKNFRILLVSGKTMLRLVKNTFMYYAVFTALGTICNIALAIMLNECHGKHFARYSHTVMILPTFLSWVAVTYIAKAFLGTSDGLINTQRRMIVYIEAILLLASLFMTYTAWRHIAVQRDARAGAVRDIAGMHTDRIRSILSKTEIVNSMIGSSNSTYIDMAMAYSGDRIQDYKAYGQIVSRLNSDLESVLSGTAEDYSVLWLMDDRLPLTRMFAFPAITPREISLTQTPGRSLYLARLSNFSGEGFVRAALENDAPVYTALGKGFLCIARHNGGKRFDKSAGAVRKYDLGVLAISFDLSGCFDEMKRAEGMQNAHCCLLDGAGNVLIADCGRSDCPAAGEGRGDYMALAEELNSGLRISVIVPWRDIDQTAATIFISLAVLAALLILAGLITAQTVSSSFIKPIEQFTALISRGAVEEIDAGVYAGYKSNIQSLFERYNAQIRRIRQLIENVKEQEKREYDVRMQLLQAQINPHFIYNTFNAISYRELMRGEDDVANILDDMSAIMRYSIKEADQLVPFARELDILEKYIRIERECSAIPILFEQGDVSAYLDFPVPKMILQPLAENALLHGRNTDDKAVRLKLKTEIRSDEWLIRLRDSGRNKDIAALNARLEADLPSPGGRGIGMLNVHLRIKRRFGAPCGLHFEQTPEKNTVAVLRIRRVARPFRENQS